MQPINRDAITVSARKPLIDWVNSQDPMHPIQFRDPSNYDESTIYLLAEIEIEEDFKAWIRKNYKVIFEEELFNWDTDKSKWPKPLTFELFDEWIHVSYQSMVLDLSPEEPMEYEE